jgi:hypothetical protein
VSHHPIRPGKTMGSLPSERLNTHICAAYARERSDRLWPMMVQGCL